MATVFASSALNLTDGFQFAITRSGQPPTGTFTSTIINVGTAGGSGTYTGVFSYLGGTILPVSNITGYTHQTTSLTYSLSNISITALTYFDFLDNGNSVGLRQFLLSGADQISGSAFNDVLYADAGEDTLIGGTGNDTLVGGTGNDTYSVDALGDTVVENNGEGADEIQSSISFVLSANVENLLLTGVANNSATGNDLANVLTGTSGSNVLDGGSGADTMIGGGGNDTYVVDNPGDILIETDSSVDAVLSSVTYTLATNVENMTLTGTAAINATGNTVANTLIGNAAANILTGEGGNDRLDGAAGADTLVGGTGNDTYMVENAGDLVNELTNEGTDIVQSSVSWVLGANIENLTLLGSTASGTGNELANVVMGNSANNPLLRGLGGADTIMGGDGNDWLDGEAGNDALPGGHVAGNDFLYGDNGNDTILAGAGDDALYGGVGNDLMVGEVGDDLAYGGTENDAIDGRQGNDMLYGETGNDVIFGDGFYQLFGFGNDSLFGGDGNDTIMGEAGENSVAGGGDTIQGDGGGDLLDGGAGDDIIFGGDGNDVIDGDHGSDYIVGGAGAETMLGSNAVAFGGPTQGSDLFVYQSMTDAGDSIYGFDTRPGDNDGIDLRPLFDALGYAGTTPRANGYLFVFQNGANTDIYVDGDGAANGANFNTRLVSLVDTVASGVTDSFFLFQ